MACIGPLTAPMFLKQHGLNLLGFSVGSVFCGRKKRSRRGGCSPDIAFDGTSRGGGASVISSCIPLPPGPIVRVRTLLFHEKVGQGGGASIALCTVLPAVPQTCS